MVVHLEAGPRLALLTRRGRRPGATSSRSWTTPRRPRTAAGHADECCNWSGSMRAHQRVDRGEGVATGQDGSRGRAPSAEGVVTRTPPTDTKSVGLKVALASADLCDAADARCPRSVNGLQRRGTTSSSRYRKQSTPQIQAAVRSQTTACELTTRAAAASAVLDGQLDVGTHVDVAEQRRGRVRRLTRSPLRGMPSASRAMVMRVNGLRHGNGSRVMCHDHARSTCPQRGSATCGLSGACGRPPGGGYLWSAEMRLHASAARQLGGYLGPQLGGSPDRQLGGSGGATRRDQ